MKKFKCDICGKEVRDEFQLNTLLPGISPPLYDIEDVCKDCMNEIEKVNTKIQAVVEKSRQNWLQKVIIKMFERYNHE